MALNSFKCNYLTPLQFKGLTIKTNCALHNFTKKNRWAFLLAKLSRDNNEYLQELSAIYNLH